MRIGLAGVGRIGAFHADTLRSLEAVDQLVVADVDAARARQVADEKGLEFAATTEELLDSGLDALVIATATPGHAPLLRAGVVRGIPTFCEKPVASTLDETIDLTRWVDETDVPVHVGFQRRFDRAYRRARASVGSGELGFVHTVVANTRDSAPPHPSYVPGSGGIFRDCNVHDFDIIRFVTGREVVSVYATGSNRGASFFAEAGDVDTGAALLTLDDGTIAQVSSTRYNGAGHDVRLEVLGERGAVAVGLDDSLALRSMEDGVDFPHGPTKLSFMERFLPAYRAELTAFFDVAARRIASPCTLWDALQAFRVAEACEISRAERRVVDLTEIKGA